MKRIAIVAATLIAMLPVNSWANDTYNGKITALQMTDTGNMQLRVVLDTAMPNCELNFAFVDANSPALNLYSAGLMTAYSQGKTVQLQVTREDTGFCRIFFINI